jgi:hypothetical protein
MPAGREQPQRRFVPVPGSSRASLVVSESVWSLGSASLHQVLLQTYTFEECAHLTNDPPRKRNPEVGAFL